MAGYSELRLHDGYISGSQIVPEEMPRVGRERIYSNVVLEGMETDRSGRHKRPDVIVAVAVLVFSAPVMAFNFPLGTVIGMPAFAYLLAAAKGR